MAKWLRIAQCLVALTQRKCMFVNVTFPEYFVSSSWEREIYSEYSESWSAKRQLNFGSLYWKWFLRAFLARSQSYRNRVKKFVPSTKFVFTHFQQEFSRTNHLFPLNMYNRHDGSTTTKCQTSKVVRFPIESRVSCRFYGVTFPAFHCEHSKYSARASSLRLNKILFPADRHDDRKARPR